MSKITEVERRLINWARWKASEGAIGGLGYASPSTFSGVGGGAYGSAIPMLGHEAADTDSAIMELGRDAQATLFEVYVSDPPSDVLSQRLGVGADAVRRRVDQAHRALQRIFEDRAQALKTAREAFEVASKCAK